MNDHTSLRLERLFPVAPEGLFAAFVDGEQFREWFGPAGFAVSSLRFDPLNEPEYRLVMQPPTGDVFHIGGRFLAVEPPRRLVYTFLYEEPDPDDLETEVTVTFDPADPGTRLLLDQGPFKTAARRQLHHDGWTQTLERLEQYVRDHTRSCRLRRCRLPAKQSWYHPDYYGGYVLDPDGNNIEAVCHRPG